MFSKNNALGKILQQDYSQVVYSPDGGIIYTNDHFKSEFPFENEIFPELEHYASNKWDIFKGKDYVKKSDCIKWKAL